MKVFWTCVVAILCWHTTAFAQILPESWTLNTTLNCSSFTMNLHLRKVADNLLVNGGPSGDEGSESVGIVYRINKTIDAVKTGEASRDSSYKLLSQRNTSSLSGATIALLDDSARIQNGER